MVYARFLFGCTPASKQMHRYETTQNISKNALLQTAELMDTQTIAPEKGIWIEFSIVLCLQYSPLNATKRAKRVTGILQMADLNMSTVIVLRSYEMAQFGFSSDFCGFTRNLRNNFNYFEKLLTVLSSHVALSFLRFSKISKRFMFMKNHLNARNFENHWERSEFGVSMTALLNGWTWYDAFKLDRVWLALIRISCPKKRVRSSNWWVRPMHHECLLLLDRSQRQFYLRFFDFYIVE